MQLYGSARMMRVGSRSFAKLSVQKRTAIYESGQRECWSSAVGYFNLSFDQILAVLALERDFGW